MRTIRKTGFLKNFSAIAAAVCIFMMAAGVGAAEPGRDMSLTMTKIHQKAATEAGVRIIVGVKAGFTPEGYLSRSRAADQRHGIARAQSRLLERLRQQNIPLLREATQFRTIPSLALT